MSSAAGLVRPGLLTEGERIEGGTTGLTFRAPWRTPFDASDLYRFELALKAGGALTLAWRRTGAGAFTENDPAQSGERVLLAGVRTAEFSYFDAKAFGRGAWVEQWLERDRVPAAVRLRLAFADGAGDWPEMIVALNRTDAGLQFAE